MLEGVIYCWTNKTNGKKYIGQTYREDKRKQRHLQIAKKKHGGLSSFHTALREIGVENFSYEVLFRCQLAEKEELLRILDEKEHYYIHKYKSYLTEYGYNETLNGQYKKDQLNNANNQNKKLRFKNRKRTVTINEGGKIVRFEKQPKETKKQERERHEREAAAEWLGNLCNALGVPMASFEMVKFTMKPEQI